jgi:hypothetical protein
MVVAAVDNEWSISEMMALEVLDSGSVYVFVRLIVFLRF